VGSGAPGRKWILCIFQVRKLQRSATHSPEHTYWRAHRCALLPRIPTSFHRQSATASDLAHDGTPFSIFLSDGGPPKRRGAREYFPPFPPLDGPERIHQKLTISNVNEQLTCASFICSFVKFTQRGLMNSTTNGRPVPNILTSTSSRPEAEKRHSLARTYLLTGSQMCSSTEDSDFLSPSISHGVWLSSRLNLL